MKPHCRLSLATLSVAVLSGCASGKIESAKSPAAPHHGAETEKSVSAEQALSRLREGNERFRSGQLQHPDQGVSRLHEISSGQHPFAIVVSCSDSRVPPEIVFDEGLGDLFVVREAGHVADAATLGSIEYAVEHLHAHLVVVLGHENCGAVAAAADVITKNAKPEGHIVTLVDDIRPAIERSQSGPGSLVARAVRANVDMVADNIRGSHPILFEHLAHGDVKVVGAVYDLKTGAIEWR